jgi:hypothetical protein
MCWVWFDEFTNNAKIFDFGNGAGKGNVFLGIYGKGDDGVDAKDLRPLLCGEESTVPGAGSGAQPVEEMTPQMLMAKSDANVNEFKCMDFEVKSRRLGPSTVRFPARKPSGKATLHYEIWDQQSRKLSIKVNSVIPVKRWTHICVTTLNNDAVRPTIMIYVDGKLVRMKEDGFLPSTGTMSNCYLGKSNWIGVGDQYENRDELFKGRLFDFRAYKRAVGEQLITDSYKWGLESLGLDKDRDK